MRHVPPHTNTQPPLQSSRPVLLPCLWWTPLLTIERRGRAEGRFRGLLGASRRPLLLILMVMFLRFLEFTWWFMEWNLLDADLKWKCLLSSLFSAKYYTRSLNLSIIFTSSTRRFKYPKCQESNVSWILLSHTYLLANLSTQHSFQLCWIWSNILISTR